jgi:hypothetical protein
LATMNDFEFHYFANAICMGSWMRATVPELSINLRVTGQTWQRLTY